MVKYTGTLLPQSNSPEEIKKSILDLLKKINGLAEATKELVPVGFVYTQVAGQAAPEALWGFGEWEEISASVWKRIK